MIKLKTFNKLKTNNVLLYIFTPNSGKIYKVTKTMISFNKTLNIQQTKENTLFLKLPQNISPGMLFNKPNKTTKN